MNIQEAHAWLRGERSWTNYFPVTENYMDQIQKQIAIAQCDAAYTMQAYYIAKANKEKLLEEIDVYTTTAPNNQ